MERVPCGRFGFLVIRGWRGWFIMSLSTVVLGVLVGVGYTISTPGYADIERLTTAWTGKPDPDLSKIRRFLSRHPEMFAKYSGQVTQKLLLAREYRVAEVFMKLGERHRLLTDSYHVQFSRNSLLVAEQKLSEALAEARALQMRMDTDPVPQDVLYGHNLLRIALLHESLGDRVAAQKSWHDVMIFFERIPRIVYDAINRAFQEGDVSLRDFVISRMQQPHE